MPMFAMIHRRCLILGLLTVFNIIIILWRVLSNDDVLVPSSTSQADTKIENVLKQLYAGKHLLSRGDYLNTTTVPGLEELKMRAGTTADLTSLPDDAHRLMDIQDFIYYLQQPACSPHIRALIVVHTAPQNFQKRKDIRETWGSPAILRLASFRILFLLGAVNDLEMQEKLERENNEFADFVQGSFMDAYQNMTYKHVMGLKWYLYNCAHAQLLIKVDDDIFLNTPKLMQLASHSNLEPTKSTQTEDYVGINSLPLFEQTRGLLFCKEMQKASVKRTYRSKWRVSFQEYPEPYYPPYCPGFVIMYSTDVVSRLYQSAQRHKYFWIDDVLITGILAQLNNIKIKDAFDYMLADGIVNSISDLETQKSKESTEFLFTPHNITTKQVHALWKLVSIAIPTAAPPNFTAETDAIEAMKATSATAVVAARRKRFTSKAVKALLETLSANLHKPEEKR